MTKTILHPICPESEVLPLIEMKQVPVHCNVLWSTREGAINASRGDIRLGYFPECGHIFNLDFDPSLMEYTQEYENSLHFSARFQEYATALAKRLIERYDLHDKDIIDIGAGKGDFLLMMCDDIGNNRGWGFDPSYVPDPAYSSEKVQFILDFYTEKYTSYKADLIACRHVLEHIETPDEFIGMVRRTVGDRKETAVFFEVPNALFTIERGGIWDIIYEHCSYFTPHSLAYLFRKHGFEVLDVREVFGGQFVSIEAKISDTNEAISAPSADLSQLQQAATTFAESYRQKVESWREKLTAVAANNQKAVIWGSGSKGVTFLNVLDPERVIKYAVDINPRKQGKFIAGTGQEIVPSEFLRDYQPDLVIIMNANYKDEISQMLQELGVAAEVLLA